MHRTGEKSRAGRRESCPAALRSSGGRAVLAVLTENGQQRRPGGQDAAVIKRFSGFGNIIPSSRKDEVPSCMVSAVSKQRFAIYRDDPEDKENYSCQVSEELELSHCELDTSAMTSSIHRLLDLSSGSPMVVDTSFQSQPEDHMEDVVTLAVGEYAEDIHQYLREAELRFRPKPFYMKKQPDITTGMRAILVDWLVEVGEEYKLRTETLYLAVNFLDRFLSCMSVLRGKLQLVGTAAILLAAKYEEIYPPDVDEFVYITDDTYTKKQLLRMEHLLLKVLGFDLTAPTINQFLLQYIQRCGICMRTENFARSKEKRLTAVIGVSLDSSKVKTECYLLSPSMKYFDCSSFENAKADHAQFAAL
ncbi:Cyclin-A1 [Lonchura striata]|uniref:Cyclin-A1 n=1 Tax=Lonchura striata TaxID=40157 RepID=A0A218V6C1_9PASE|nr:Cyclin-A1 [Lonchura striata domestica]